MLKFMFGFTIFTWDGIAWKHNFLKIFHYWRDYKWCLKQGLATWCMCWSQRDVLTWLCHSFKLSKSRMGPNSLSVLPLSYTLRRYEQQNVCTFSWLYFFLIATRVLPLVLSCKSYIASTVFLRAGVSYLV